MKHFNRGRFLLQLFMGHRPFFSSSFILSFNYTILSSRTDYAELISKHVRYSGKDKYGDADISIHIEECLIEFAQIIRLYQ